MQGQYLFNYCNQLINTNNNNEARVYNLRFKRINGQTYAIQCFSNTRLYYVFLQL